MEFLRAGPRGRAALEKREAVKGEFTVLVGRSERRVTTDEPVVDAVKRLEAAGLTRMDAIKAVAKERGSPKREVYRMVEEG